MKLIDPIAKAWKQSHKSPLPKPLVVNEMQRAGQALAVLGKKGKGKHVMAVCA